MIERLAIYTPMLVGALIGYLVSRFGGLGGVMGMTAGAVIWLAYEMRKNTRRMEIDRKIMEHDLEWLRKQQK